MWPPRYHVSPPLLETLKRIAVLTHELNKQRLPEVALAELQQEARAVSAYASTSIEGNPLPLTEVRRLLKGRPEQIHQSEREILNYNQVLLELSAAPGAPVTRELLLRIHHGVTQGLLPDYQAGRFRQEPVLVRDPRTGEVIYLPPDHNRVPSLVDALLAFVAEQQGRLDPVIVAGLFHRQLVIIHPFMDGNGRTARLATNLLLAGMGLNLFSLFSFENYYSRNVSRYFAAVGVTGNYYDLIQEADFTRWLEYFAEGALDELLRVEDRLAQRQATPARRLQPYHQAMLDFIDAHGFITDRDYAGLTERAKATRSLDFKKLMAMGLIIRQGKGRGTYYQRPSSY